MKGIFEFSKTSSKHRENPLPSEQTFVGSEGDTYCPDRPSPFFPQSLEREVGTLKIDQTLDCHVSEYTQPRNRKIAIR